MTNWELFQNQLYFSAATGLMLDRSGMDMSEDFFAAMDGKLTAALADMQGLDGGAVANPDEGRMVGHYWLRNAALAPTEDLRREIEDCLEKVKDFTAKVHSGEVRSGTGKKFRNVLVAGIGGSSLGPVFVSEALATPADKMTLRFLDNTDPRGIEDTLLAIEPELEETLTIVISKSGGPIESRN